MKAQSATASSTLSTTRAPAKMSSAPAASAVDSACGNERGLTRTRSESAMFFMAGAPEPILPGWLGSMSTTRTRLAIDDILASLMQPLLNIAMRAARRAGDLLVKSLSRLDSLKIDTKGRNDFVTDIDRKAEADIIATIRRSYPQHAVLAEESGRSGENEFVWIIDPLDGTTNFLHGFPTFAVSIALEHKGRLQHAVVYDPMRQEFFTASRGDGAQLEGKKIRVSTQRTLEGSLIGTGFPFRSGSHVDAYLAMLKVVMSTAAGVRRPGAAALDLAYVAAGRIDGFWEFGLSPWDTAAGTLLIQEAGGRVGTATGAEYSLGENIVAGNPKVYQALLEVIGPLTPASLRV